MSTKYFCAHCDEEFTPERPEAKPRCPRCMRRSGVEPVRRAPAASTSGRRAGIIALVALAIIALGYAAYRYQTVELEETPPLRPLEAAELAAYLERDQIRTGVHATLFSLPASVEGWPGDPAALAEALHGESSRWSLERPLPRAVFSADQTLAALRASDERVEVYPLELAVAMTALLRAQGTDAMVAEVWALGEAEAPLDPSGMMGYFVTAVLAPGTADPLAFYDPWGGRGEVTPSAVRLLRDTEAIGAALGTDAVRVFARSGDRREALARVETALRLDARSPSLRIVHGTILLDSGGVPQALEELEAAVELRGDAPRHLNMAQLKLAEAGMLAANGAGEAAETALADANRIVTGLIQESPRYGRAHLTLATIHLGLADLDRARVELQAAERLSPDSPMLWAAWAQYHLAVEDLDAAVAKMNRAIALHPESWQLRLQAAGVFRAAGHAQAARENADEALRLVVPERRNELRSYLDQMMGPAQLELPDPVASGAGATEGSGTDPALMLGDPANLRLRNPDEELHLDLDE
jgi:tetratricopeptide (TPR) repeat protein